MQVSARCGAVRLTSRHVEQFACRHVERTPVSLSWSPTTSRNFRSIRYRSTRSSSTRASSTRSSRRCHSSALVPAQLFNFRQFPGRLHPIAVIPLTAVDLASRRGTYRSAAMASAAMHAAAVACIYSSSISLPLSPPHPVRPARRYSAPPLRATWRGMAGDIAAIAAAEGAATASGATAASLPPPSSSPSSPHSSSPSSSADASASSADPASPPHHTSKRQYEIGALQQLPAVSPAAEIIGTALRRAKHVRASKGIMNAVKRERSKGAQQLDCLTKEISGPLGRYVRLFPRRHQLHPFERQLVELTLGEGVYEEVLARVDALRKKVLDVGKNAASLVNKTSTMKEAEEVTAQGISQLGDLYTRNSHAVERLKEITKRLRGIPVVRPDLPTLCLVGAPNVGKSSLVRAISSGKPEVCNYPFTTRGISMGHFYVDTRKHQVTDTPGLLSRPDAQRNNIELLTIAAITHLPTAVLFVHDPSEECGVNRLKQYQLYSEMKTRFADRVWIDVISKCDLPAATAPLGEAAASGHPGTGDESRGGHGEASRGGEDQQQSDEEAAPHAINAPHNNTDAADRSSNSTDSCGHAARLLGGAEPGQGADVGEKVAVAAGGAGMAAWEEYRTHGGPAAALRVSTVSGLGVDELVDAIHDMLSASSAASSDSLPASAPAAAAASHASAALPSATARDAQGLLIAADASYNEGSMHLPEDGTGQGAELSLQALEGDEGVGGSGKAGKKGKKPSDFYYPPLPSHMMKGT